MLVTESLYFVWFCLPLGYCMYIQVTLNCSCYHQYSSRLSTGRFKVRTFIEKWSWIQNGGNLKLAQERLWTHASRRSHIVKQAGTRITWTGGIQQPTPPLWNFFGTVTYLLIDDVCICSWYWFRENTVCQSATTNVPNFLHWNRVPISNFHPKRHSNYAKSQAGGGN